MEQELGVELDLRMEQDFGMNTYRGERIPSMSSFSSLVVSPMIGHPASTKYIVLRLVSSRFENLREYSLRGSPRW